MLSLGLLLLLGAVVWLWVDNISARDLARQICLAECQRARVQLLDQSVALSRLRVTGIGRGRLALRRRFSFEFSQDGEGRRQGTLWLLGRELQWLSFENDRGEDIIAP